MTQLLVASVLLGLDGFVVCLALGPFRLGMRHALPLAGLFGLCDGLALLAGSIYQLNIAVLPLLMALWAVLVLLLAISGARRLLPVLPVLLAFDNLLEGVAGGRTVLLEDAVLSCAVSAALAGAGLLAGRALAQRIHLRPGFARFASAGLLLAVGFVAMAG
jgi:hypothetical protein